MIQVENITKRYGTFTAVNKINFEIEEGEVVGFLGPNGAGKSTTMNMITGFIEPSSGRILVDGYDVSKKPKKAKICARCPRVWGISCTAMREYNANIAKNCI